MPKSRSIDIDSLDDFRMAEYYQNKSEKIQILVDTDSKKWFRSSYEGIAIWQMLYDSYDVYLMINLKHYNFIEVYLNKKIKINFYTSENLIEKLSGFSVNEIIFF